MSAPDAAREGWALLPDGTSHRPAGHEPRDAWEGGTLEAPGKGWTWTVRFVGHYAVGVVSGFSRTRAGAEGQATRFAIAALRAL